MSILATIIEQKKLEIAALDAVTLRRAAESSPTPRDFLAAIKRRRFGTHPSLIAELKRASPSKGILAPHLDLFQVADIYAQNGAAAVSVLTDEKFFLGRLDDLRALRQAHAVPVPLLRKDFMLDAYQIVEARAIGADCILLIMAALTRPESRSLYTLARDLGLDVLAEIHDPRELDQAAELEHAMLGVNNRDLRTLQVDIATFERLAGRAPAGRLLVAESGLKTAADVRRVAAAGACAILVGESLMSQPDVTAATRALLDVEPAS